MKPFDEEGQKNQSIKIGKYTIYIHEENQPSPEAIRNCNQVINELMKKYHNKIDYKSDGNA